VGEDSTMATPGSGSGTYPAHEGPTNVFDRNLKSEFSSFGDEDSGLHGKD